jgi:uncharacterized membrane protein
VATSLGLVAALGLAAVTTWQLALLGGWDTFSLTILLAIRPIIIRAHSAETEHLATREDETQSTASLLVLGASLASLFAVAFVLSLAGRETGGLRTLLIAMATITVVLSWTLVNTVFTLRYAHLYFSSSGDAVEFSATGDDEGPDYRDFAYLAFTIGMTYQVSDTALRGRGIRRTVLVHALLSYIFGVVIVAAGINLIAGLVK